ncbi:MAG: hypothetical protein ACI9JM_000031 [Halioglobus sp.]
MEIAVSSETTPGHIVIGLGTGRSGTASLTSLIDRQSGGICFHEMNPSGAVFSGNPQPHLNAIQEYQAILRGGHRCRLAIDYARPSSVTTYDKLQTMAPVKLIGDIAYYYLNYVDDLLESVPQCVFVCIKRNKNQTVASWLKKSSIGRWRSLWLADKLKSWLTRTPFHTEYNYWQEHDGKHWKKDPVWDSCFPKFEAASKEDAIRLYWDYYYLEADRLQRKHPDKFRVFDIEDLSTPSGQRRILSFIGLAEESMVYGEEVHLHRSN